MADQPEHGNFVGTSGRASGSDPTLSRHISRVAAVFDAAPVGVGVWSVDGELLHANPVLCDLMGRPRSELIGSVFEAYIRPQEAPAIRLAIEQVWLAERNAFACDLRCQDTTGSALWLRAQVAPVYGPGGQPAYFTSHIFDFEPRVLAEDRGVHLAEETPVMLWMTDDRGVPRHGNRASRSFIGESGSGALPVSFLDLVHPDDVESMQAEIRDRIRTREPFEFTARARALDGSWRWLHHRARPVTGTDGQFEGWAGASLDVTDAEQLRRELDEVRLLFQGIAEAGPVAVVRTDAAGHVTYANGRWSAIVDDPQEALLDLGWQSVIAPEHIDELVRRSAHSVTTGEPFLMRVRAQLPAAGSDRSDRPYWGELRVAPVFDARGEHDGFVATLADVTNEVAADTRADHLARVMDAGSDFLLITDRTGAVSYVNDATVATLGVEAPEHPGAEPEAFLLDVLDAESFEIFHEEVIPVLADEGLWRGELTLCDRDGGLIPVSALVLAQAGPNGPLDTLSVVARDISDLKQAATYDYLTGLLNRFGLSSRLHQALARFERYGEAAALLYLDLDNFKPINDAMGHHVGDAVLVQIADRIHDVIRDVDTAARIGGDEFAVLVSNLDDIEAVTRVADRLLEAIGGESFDVEGITAELGVSIGVVVANEFCHDPDELMALADSAMYQAKLAGRARYELIIPTHRARP